jgi:FkbM family methyltransferase
MVRMPAEFAGGSWEEHEPETVAALSTWVREHPDALVLDIGSSIGVFSAVALFASPRAEVVAFDSDLPSLAAVRRLCQHASGGRLRLAWGFLTDTATDERSIGAVVGATRDELAKLALRGGDQRRRYVCLTDADKESIPSHRLDALFADEAIDGRAVLIKCDVEGAEMLVLRGAEAFIRRVAPVVALSVHPPTLPDYGHTKADVATLLEELGYGIRILAVDHEEHWWCERRA